MRVVVVGGVAGGATAIARLRRLDENAEIILLERGDYVSFANCGLPYYVGGTIARRDALFVSTKEDIEAKYGVDIRTKNEVVKIKPEDKEVIVKDLNKDEEYSLSYDKLLLSTGSKPFVPPVPGTDLPGVFTLWTIPDVDAITDYIKTERPKKAVVVGGGFIGLEMAENLVDRGIEVTLVEMAPQVMPPLDEDMAKVVANHLVAKGVKLMLSTGFAGVKDGGKTVMTSDGAEIATDMVLMSIGVRPNSELAKEAGLDLNERGGIKVNDLLQSSNPDIYAVGDVIGVTDYVLGGETMIPLAGPANKQGRLVAGNLLGKTKEAYEGTMGSSVAKIFDLTVAGVGANEKTLMRQGMALNKDYYVTIIHPMSHAGYYPGATPMSLKLIYGVDGKVLGAQIVGYEGVDKRIDTIATTIHFKGSVNDLAELELAYAPPYSNAKDPVNFAGFTAQNVLEGLSEPITYSEYKAHEENYILLDVREDMEVLAHSVEGAVHIPLTQLRDRLDELDKDGNYLAFCAVGLRGYVAERILKQNQFKAANLVGGLRTMLDLEQDLTSSASGPSIRMDQDKIVGQEDEGEDPDPEQQTSAQQPVNKVEILDVCGLSCPGPIVQVAKSIQDINDGDILEITATDPGFVRDIDNWAQNTGNTLIDKGEGKGKFWAMVQKGTPSTAQSTDAPRQPSPQAPRQKEKTMIVFDGDLDKAIASFIIANGAAAMGNKVHMFFTFWGLSILRKKDAPKVKKDTMGKMFGRMLPKGSKKLGLSKMNFMGAGSKMIRGVMKKKGIYSLEELIQEAQSMGVELTACQMTMDIMGLTKDELIDGVKIGGVATMLNDSDNSNMNLFI